MSVIYERDLYERFILLKVFYMGFQIGRPGAIFAGFPGGLATFLGGRAALGRATFWGILGAFGRGGAVCSNGLFITVSIFTGRAGVVGKSAPLTGENKNGLIHGPYNGSYSGGFFCHK